mmetsp:Transcript_41495/g.93613  ORF Transcript_41495/g.93613 Transcript_41495/m.93613 type:complete len:211 (-) Transcript_41495:2482-3114(-)
MYAHPGLLWTFHLHHCGLVCLVFAVEDYLLHFAVVTKQLFDFLLCSLAGDAYDEEALPWGVAQLKRVEIPNLDLVRVPLWGGRVQALQRSRCLLQDIHLHQGKPVRPVARWQDGDLRHLAMPTNERAHGVLGQALGQPRHDDLAGWLHLRSHLLLVFLLLDFLRLWLLLWLLLWPTRPGTLYGTIPPIHAVPVDCEGHLGAQFEVVGIHE